MEADMAPNPVIVRSGGLALDRRSVALGLLAVAAGFLPGAARAAEAVGKVSNAEGQSTGLLDGIIRELEVGSDIYLQQILQTGQQARVTITLGSETSLKLGARTRLRIDSNLIKQGGEISLAGGAILFERPDTGKHGDVVVKTPFAIIAARGTTFWNGPSNDVTGVFVQSGRVSVRNRGGGVVLAAGEGTDLTSPDAKPTTPKAWGEARIAAALATVN
jgi:ferric-dicitrate binding protein FerR (iron transport regulator)